MLVEGHGDGLLFGCKHRRDGLGTHHRIRRRRMLAPLGYGFGVDAVALGERM